MMNKKEFIDLCQRSSKSSRLDLYIRQVPLEDVFVGLSGNWANGSILKSTIYKPKTQMMFNWHSNLLKCQKEIKKYQRWLMEFKADFVI